MEFGDKVRVRDTAEAMTAGLAGKQGDILGFTTPSVTGVEVIGSLSDDFALSVDLEDMEEQFWFSPDQLEMIGHNPGMEITLDGVDKKWVRTESGAWDEKPLNKNRPWWKFWQRE